MERLAELSLGTPLPPLETHAISVSIPTWQEFVGCQEGVPSLVKHMRTGYPRFVIHALILQLADIFLQKEGNDGEKCMLFPTASDATACKAFLLAQTSDTSPSPSVRQHHFALDAKEGMEKSLAVDLHAVFYPGQLFPIAKLFWQHTGCGISSRLAQRGLDLLEVPGVLPASRYGTPIRCRKYVADSSPSQNHSEADADHSAAQAKAALRHRIAGFLTDDDSPSQNAVREDDVFLYPAGANAIWHVHKLLMAMRPTGNFVAFCFPYLDTVKVLQKWGPGCHLFGHDTVYEMNKLEEIIASSTHVPPIVAVFCEIPTNPRLQSPPIDRLRALADKHDFLLVVDDTVGTFVNVDVLPYADIIITSLSKYFCGYANALGGSIALNPRMKHYQALKAALGSSYVDTYFEEDAIAMERSSRDFGTRMLTTNSNTNAVCELLHARSLLASPADPSRVIREIFYPKWITRDLYDICRRPGATDNFGGLFSLTFVSPLAARVFFDALGCAKGPSLGTNFTLSCPYTILAHYKERDWVAQYGVEENLVRVSVGLEDQAKLLEDFDFALRKAEEAVKEEGAQGHK